MFDNACHRAEAPVFFDSVTIFLYEAGACQGISEAVCRRVHDFVQPLFENPI
jgi:hypothetical protein